MTFQHPYLLLLLAAPLAALAWVWLRRGRRVALPADHGPPGRGGRWRLAVSAAESAPPLLLAAAVLLLAGPQTQGDPVDRRKLANIEMCVDVSASMNARFGDGTRYDGAMRAVEQFISYRKGNAFGLTFFGNEVLHWCPLTPDVSAVTCAVPFMRPGSLPPWFNGTAIGKALRAAKTVLEKRPDGDRMIVLITDGLSSDLSNGADEEVARELKDAGVTVFAVVVGADALPPAAARMGSVDVITRLTGGESFEAGDPQALAAVFRRIDGMRKAEVEKHVADTRDDVRPYCLAGLAVLVVGVVGSLGLRYTPW